MSDAGDFAVKPERPGAEPSYPHRQLRDEVERYRLATAETREECMAQFREAWDRDRAAIGDEKWCWHVAYEAELAARSARPRRY